MITVKLINGVLKRLETIFYPSTGAVVERTLPMNNDIPEEVVVIKEPNRFEFESHIPSEPIHNMEYALYAHHLRN